MRSSYIPKYYHQAIMAKRTHKDTVTVQRKLKSGAWGKPHEATRLYKESDQDVIDRLHKFNPGDEYRIAE